MTRNSCSELVWMREIDMTDDQERRLRQLSGSSVVGGDIAAALHCIDMLRSQTESMNIVLSVVAAKAEISDDELIEMLEQIRTGFIGEIDMSKVYVVEFADYDGYNQQFAKIGDHKDVDVWAKDGSIKKGDVVFELKETKQPNLLST